jgi:hypothetical protein
VSRHHRNGNRGRAAVELGSSVGETAKAQEEQFAGVLVVLMRAGIKALGFCTELSTAATMWWPAAAREFVACVEKGSKEGGTGPGRGEREAWREGKQEVGCARPAQRRPGEPHRRQRRGGKGIEGLGGRRREGKGPKDLCAKLKDSRGLAVKQNFPLI